MLNCKSLQAIQSWDSPHPPSPKIIGNLSKKSGAREPVFTAEEHEKLSLSKHMMNIQKKKQQEYANMWQKTHGKDQWFVGGMTVTCDHRIRSLATINKKTGFGSLTTTKCGHLRPQKVTFADRANKTSTMTAVTCDHILRSLATKNWNHLAWVGGWGGWVGVG